MTSTKQKAPEPSRVTGAFQNQQAANCKPVREFLGTDKPRYLRAITALMRRPVSRQNLDSIAGCANGPALVAELRWLNLEVPCERVEVEDRDGNTCRPGVYSFTESDRRKIHRWMKRRGVTHG